MCTYLFIYSFIFFNATASFLEAINVGVGIDVGVSTKNIRIGIGIGIGDTISMLGAFKINFSPVYEGPTIDDVAVRVRVCVCVSP